MKLKQLVSRMRGSEPVDSLENRHIPLMVTPLENEPSEHAKQLASRESSPDDAVSLEPRFKKHHEASAIELFYDLFFVANLATFTVNHEITDPTTFRSYLGFFSLLWATWLQTTLFDVRFAYDSIFLRICKALHFGVQIGFVLAGAVYSTDPAYADTAAFQTLAIVQMISRVTLVVQYASVLYYIKGYPRTRVPLLLIMAVLFAAGMLYLGTYWGFNPATNKTYYAWYIAAPIEVVLCIIVSSIWRVLSFKNTHLVERVGLLTLIVIGEGILGLSKSVSYLLQASTTVSARNAGVLVCSVLLIYFIWMLYFDQTQNNRQGTIKQQIWTLLHYPLHLAILFTVEGSTNLFTWESVIPNYIDWLFAVPAVSSPSFFEDFPDAGSLLSYVETTLKDFSTRFNKDKQIYKYYDYNVNITSLENITAPYGTAEYQNQSQEIILEMWQGVGNAIFEVFGVIAPEPSTPTTTLTGSQAEEDEYYRLFYIYDVVFRYFYIAAGCFLIVLALLYIIGNKRKTAGEYVMVSYRVVAGLGITMTIVGLLYSPNYTLSLKFYTSPWHVIMVMLIYLTVIVLDNILIEGALRRRRQRHASGASDTEKQSSVRRSNTNVYSYKRARNSEDDTAYHPHNNRTIDED